MKQKIIICELMCLSLNSLKTFKCWEIVCPVQKSVWNWNIRFLPRTFETLKLYLYGDVVTQSAFFSEILGLLQVELLVWMVCDRFICNFAITGVRMNVGIDQPSTWSLNTGMLFCAASIFDFVVWDAESKEVLQIPFSFQGDHWSVWGRVRYKIFTKTSYFQFVGSCGLLW